MTALNDWRVGRNSENILVIHIQLHLSPTIHVWVLGMKKTVTKLLHRSVTKYCIIGHTSVTDVGPSHKEERVILYLTTFLSMF